ncbi:MAG: T9SS type A sorting domain-containing protein [Bacteroidetes bacterium]|nr:T9SS type A sorting domain-containing protein [Bacteroidota bacterium]
MKQKILTFIMFIIAVPSAIVYGQSLNVVASAGTYTEGPGGSVSWTLGEMVITTLSGSSNDVTQGFHQGNIYVSGLDDLRAIEVNIYPNPTSEFVTIQSPEPVRVKIFDVSGRLVSVHDLSNEINQLNVSDFARGTYNLVFESAGRETRTAQLVVM